MPNPMVKVAIDALKETQVIGREKVRIADQGCGQLRHYKLLTSLAGEIYLVDTHAQLTKFHSSPRGSFTIVGFVEKENQNKRQQVRVITADEFGRSRLQLDVIFSIAVLDVVLPVTRRSIIQSASRNLRDGGYFVLIVPRNDSSILKRCTKANAYLDGHVFARDGKVTFYRNFRSKELLERLCIQVGLVLVRDLSRFRQVCILWRRTSHWREDKGVRNHFPGGGRQMIDG